MSLQTIVTNAPLAEDVRAYLLERIEKEGATEDVLATVKEALQAYIDAGFKAEGVVIDNDHPTVVAAQQTFAEEVADATAEFTEETENLAIDAAVEQAKANKALDRLQAGAVKAQMAA